MNLFNLSNEICGKMNAKQSDTTSRLCIITWKCISKMKANFCEYTVLFWWKKSILMNSPNIVFETFSMLIAKRPIYYWVQVRFNIYFRGKIGPLHNIIGTTSNIGNYFGYMIKQFNDSVRRNCYTPFLNCFYWENKMLGFPLYFPPRDWPTFVNNRGRSWLKEKKHHRDSHIKVP